MNKIQGKNVVEIEPVGNTMEPENLSYAVRLGESETLIVDYCDLPLITDITIVSPVQEGSSRKNCHFCLAELTHKFVYHWFCVEHEGKVLQYNSKDFNEQTVSYDCGDCMMYRKFGWEEDNDDMKIVRDDDQWFIRQRVDSVYIPSTVAINDVCGISICLKEGSGENSKEYIWIVGVGGHSDSLDDLEVIFVESTSRSAKNAKRIYEIFSDPDLVPGKDGIYYPKEK